MEVAILSRVLLPRGNISVDFVHIPINFFNYIPLVLRRCRGALPAGNKFKDRSLHSTRDRESNWMESEYNYQNNTK